MIFKETRPDKEQKNLDQLEAIWNNILGDKNDLEEALATMDRLYGFVPDIKETKDKNGK